MATQDWLSGGFVGRLGAVVGQRYHSKWYVHTYVPPTYTRTPEQAANRDAWRLACQHSSLCARLPETSFAWDTSQVGSYAQRCGVAQKAIRAQSPASGIFPLTPQGGGRYAVTAMTECFWESASSVLSVAVTLTGVGDYASMQEELAWVSYRVGGVWALVRGEYVLSSGDTNVNLTFPLPSQPPSGTPIGVSLVTPSEAGQGYAPWYLTPYSASVP